MPPDQVQPVGPGGPYLQQSQIGGRTVYRATLPAGTIQAGSFSITASGGADIGPFQSTTQIGHGIVVTTPLAGKTFPIDQPLTINWTGGDPNAWVTFVCPQYLGMVGTNYVAGRVPASAGAFTLQLAPMGGTARQPILELPCQGPNREIIVEVGPDPSQIQTFGAPGLSLGGESTWKYTYRFEGVTVGVP